MAEQYIQVSRSLLVSGRLMSMGGKVSRCHHTALLAIAVGLESVHSWFAPVQMARTLTWKLEIVPAAANDHYSIQWYVEQLCQWMIVIVFFI